MRHAAEIGAMQVHRFLGGIEHVLFSARSDVFFEYVNKHVRVFHIGLAVHGKIRHLLVTKLRSRFQILYSRVQLPPPKSPNSRSSLVHSAMLEAAMASCHGRLRAIQNQP